MIDKVRTFFKNISQTKLSFIVLGIGSTIWFLIRVIPKPSRAGYPCMKAAAPVMSGFVLYLLALGGSAMLFKRTFSKLRQARYFAASVAFFGFIMVVVVFNFNDARQSFAIDNLAVPSAESGLLQEFR